MVAHWCSGGVAAVGLIDWVPLDKYGHAPRWARYPQNDPTANTRGKFTTTLHLITSAIKKLSTLQPSATVYFGKAGKFLPKALETANELGVRMGVEYGFQSTTLDRNTAAKYGRDSDNRPELSFIFSAKVRRCTSLPGVLRCACVGCNLRCS